MAPTTILGVILFLAVLLPGFAWLWTSERRGPMVVRPATAAIAELAVVGTFVAAVAFGIVVSLGMWLSWLIDVPAWLVTGDPTAYLGENFWQAWASFFLQLVVGTALAVGAAAAIHRPGRTVFSAGGTVLHQVLEAERSVPRPTLAQDGAQSRQALMFLQMTDGTVIQAYSRCFPADRNEPYLAIESPISVGKADSEEDPEEKEADCVIANMNQVAYAAVRYEDPGDTDSDRERHHSRA